MYSLTSSCAYDWNVIATREPLRLPPSITHRGRRGLLLFYPGLARDSGMMRLLAIKIHEYGNLDAATVAQR